VICGSKAQQALIPTALSLVGEQGFKGLASLQPFTFYGATELRVVTFTSISEGSITGKIFGLAELVLETTFATF